MIFLLTFLCGASYEICCVFWVRYIDKERTIPAVVFSMGAAFVTSVGVEGFLKSWVFKVAYALGFGAGTAVGIQIKSRFRLGA